jgi:hypothetical protein
VVTIVHKRRDAAPCFINNGTIYQKKDMLRALETLENLKYEYIVDGHAVERGQGALLKVFASRNSATLVINNCIFVNVLSFDYLHFRGTPSGATVVDLIEEGRTLRLETIDEEIKVPRSNREILASVDQYDDEETFALLEEGDNSEEED